MTDQLVPNPPFLLLVQENAAAILKELGFDYGSARLPFLGPGGPLATQVVVNHRIGRVPQVIFALVNEGSSQGITLSADTRTPTQFTLHGEADAPPTAVNVFWIALG